MRFRARFGTYGYVSVGLAAFFALLCFTSPDPGRIAVIGFPVFLLSLQHLLNHFLIYWDIEPKHLHERRLWRTTHVAWSEVTHVGYLGKSHSLSIDYSRLPPVPDRGSIIARPEDQPQFIGAIRRFAPHVLIEV